MAPKTWGFNEHTARTLKRQAGEVEGPVGPGTIPQVFTTAGVLIHFKSTGTTIPAVSGLTMGSGSVDKYNCSSSGVLSDAELAITVYNPGSEFPASTHGIAVTNEAGLAVIVRTGGGEFDVRVKPDGTALQKSTDGGTTWTDWATIREDCA